MIAGQLESGPAEFSQDEKIGGTMTKHIRFSSEKAIEVVCYLASKAPISDVYHICKLQYYADRLHLERYGRMLCGDRYIAMKNGPVPSGTYDLLKDVRDGRPSMAKEHAEASFSVSGYSVTPLREPNLDLLSESDVECLDEVIRAHGKKSFGQLNDESHDEVWNSADRDDEISLEVLANALDNSGALWEHLQNS